MNMSKMMDKIPTKDPCLECETLDKRNLFFEKRYPQPTVSKEPSAPSLFRQTLEQYQQSHLKYKHLIETAPDAIFVADTETGMILEANSKAAELLGIPADQIVGMHQSQLHPAEEAQRYKELFQERIKNNPTHMLEDIYVCNKDGKRIPVQINGASVKLGNRQVVFGIFRDRTLLKASEERFKCLAEAAFEGVVIHKDGIFIKSNRQFAAMFGFEEDEVSGLNGLDLFAPESYEFAREKITSDDPGPYNAVGLKKDGTHFPIEIRAREIVFEGGKARVASCRDLTLEKQQELRLKESRTRFKRLAEASFEGIIIHDLDHQIIDLNQQLLDMFGYTLEELKQLPMMDMVAPQSRDTVTEKIATGFQGIYDTFAMRKNGEVFPVLVNVKKTFLNENPVRIVSLYDMTELQQLKQKLSESEGRYKELYRNARAALFRTRISDGTLLDCSRATSRLFGYTYDTEFKENFSVTSTYVDPQQRELLIETLKKDKRVHGFQVQLKRKDGSPLWVAMSAEIFPEQDFIEGAMQDITITKVLTNTEKDILENLMQGMSNKEIAFKTGRSVRTIEDHRANVMRKLGVNNIVELIQKAFKLTNHHSKE
jgi:PAS domain S-box-containing protein